MSLPLNMLRAWHTPSDLGLAALVDDDVPDLPVWSEPEVRTMHPHMNADLIKDQIIQLALVKFGKVFTNTPGLTDQAKMVIETGESFPIHTPPYKVPHARQKLLEDEVEQFLRAGLIMPSKSSWASPVVLVPKKDSTI